MWESNISRAAGSNNVCNLSEAGRLQGLAGNHSWTRRRLISGAASAWHGRQARALLRARQANANLHAATAATVAEPDGLAQPMRSRAGSFLPD